jgi:hypothetical protein
MILNSPLISVSCYAAIAVFVTIFIFPETVNHAYLTGTAGLLGGLRNMLSFQDELLDLEIDSLRDETRNGGILQRISKTRIETIVKMQSCEYRLDFTRRVLDVFKVMASSGLINLEFTWGKWNGDDVRGLEDPLMAVVSRAGKSPSSSKSRYIIFFFPHVKRSWNFLCDL